MDKKIIRRRWSISLIFFCFLFIQQFNVLMVDSLRYRIEELFSSTIFNADLLLFFVVVITVGSFIVWGISFDRYSRRNLIAVGTVLWWATSWLTSLAPTFETFTISYLIGFLDLGSMTGVYSLVGDCFSPRNRGKIFGVLQIAQPIAYFMFLLYFQDFSNLNWRRFLLVSGVTALTLGLVIVLFVIEPKRGFREPALKGIRISGQYFFDWEIAKDIVEKPSFIMLCGLSLFSVLPWTGFSFWISSLLQTDQNLISDSAYPILTPIILALILGNALGGFLSDWLFRWKKRGRVIANFIVMSLALLTSISAFLLGDSEGVVFRVLVALVALFFTMGSPNIFGMLFDIALPEIRGTAISILFISQLTSVGLSVVLIDIMEKSFDMWMILFSLTLTSVLVNLLLSAGLFRRMPIEIENLRRHMAYRSRLEARLEPQEKELNR